MWPSQNTWTLLLLKPIQNKKGQKIWGTRQKSSPFIKKKTAFLAGTPNFFGPSYFETALEKKLAVDLISKNQK